MRRLLLSQLSYRSASWSGSDSNQRHVVSDGMRSWKVEVTIPSRRGERAGFQPGSVPDRLTFRPCAADLEEAEQRPAISLYKLELQPHGTPSLYKLAQTASDLRELVQAHLKQPHGNSTLHKLARNSHTVTRARTSSSQTAAG